METLLFSNLVGEGNISSSTKNNLRFNEYMEEYLKKSIEKHSNLVFINAPGLGGEENYLDNIINCFRNIGINFDSILDVELSSNENEINEYIINHNKIVYFLMGGNPITQMQIIDKFNLRKKIKSHEGLVIGFCAGALNLSKYAIITTDEDFKEASSYLGIGRVPIIVESHYNVTTDEVRNNELYSFAKQYEQKIYAIPDSSIIVVKDNSIIEYGKIYYFDCNE